MTDSEIMKALEWYVSKFKNTGYVYLDVDGTKFVSTQEVLDLITRQQAEIERLKECPKCVYEYDGETMEYCVQGPCPNFKTVEQIKSEAVKEFAERLKNEINIRTTYSREQDKNVMRMIDNLVKEMVGENNE